MCEELMTDVCCVALEQTAVGLPNSFSLCLTFGLKLMILSVFQWSCRRCVGGSALCLPVDFKLQSPPAAMRFS